LSSPRSGHGEGVKDAKDALGSNTCEQQQQKGRTRMGKRMPPNCDADVVVKDQPSRELQDKDCLLTESHMGSKRPSLPQSLARSNLQNIMPSANHTPSSTTFLQGKTDLCHRLGSSESDPEI
jgi:hypothetical protein